MNEVVVKVMQFYMAILGLELANANCKIMPSIHKTDFTNLENKLNDLFFSLSTNDQVQIAFDFYQASILLKRYANLESFMTKEQFVALAAILN